MQLLHLEPKTTHLLDGLDGPGHDDAAGLHALVGGLGVLGGGRGGQHARADLARVTDGGGRRAGAGGSDLSNATLKQVEEFVLHLGEGGAVIFKSWHS